MKMKTKKPCLSFALLLILSCYRARFSIVAGDTLSAGHSLSNMRLPVSLKAYLAVNASRYELVCMKNCSFTTYAYNRSGCMIWEGALLNLCQLSHGGKIGQDIYLRLAAAEYQNTKGEKSTPLVSFVLN
jgi:hypothetical protein